MVTFCTEKKERKSYMRKMAYKLQLTLLYDLTESKAVLVLGFVLALGTGLVILTACQIKALVSWFTSYICSI